MKNSLDSKPVPRADLLRGLADNEGLAHQLAEYQTRYGDWRELFRQLDRINAVTKADVRRVANKIFIASNRTSAQITSLLRNRKLQNPLNCLLLERLPPRRPEVRNDERTFDDAFCRRSPDSFACHHKQLSPDNNRACVNQQNRNGAAMDEDTDSTSPCVKPEQPKRIELANGLVIFLQEDHELPFINGTILIRGGSRDEPANKIGLVSLYGQTWRTSGTTTVDGDKLDNELENKAANLETSGGTATTSVNWSSLKDDFDTVFTATTDLLLHPNFKADKLLLAKRQMETGIARRNDDASEIANREAIKLVYGATNPYARQPEYATVDAVTWRT